jgi:hypothetical protein
MHNLFQSHINNNIMETLLQSILSVADMRNFQPENMRAGLKGGVFFGLLQHTVLPASLGNVECTAFGEKVFGAKGKAGLPALGIPETEFNETVTLTGPHSARVRNINLATIPQSDRITYIYKDGENEAKVEQTYANQNWIRGAYTEFWVTHNFAGYPNFNIRLWWERT